MSRKFIINGKSYAFSKDAFKQCTSIVQKKHKNGNGKVSRNTIWEELAEYVNESFESVRKWGYGKEGGPGSIELIEDIAKFFGVDVMDLLVSLDNKEESVKMKDSNYELIKTIYKKSFEILAEKTDYINQAYESAKDRNFAHKQSIAAAEDKINKLHRLVDSEALFASEYIRNDLHKLLFGIEELAHNNIPEAWRNLPEYVTTYQSCIEYAYYYQSREDVILDDTGCGLEYLIDEINMAIDWGCNGEDIKDPIDIDDMRDCENAAEYGYCGEWEITSKIVYEYTLANYLKAVFEYYFPQN